MKSARKKIVRYLLVFATLAFVCLISGIIPINASLFRAPIENAIRDATGLTISIGDSIMVRLGVSPTVKTGTLSLGGSTDGALLTAESFSATVELFPLLADRISIKQLIVTGVGVDYCSSIPKRPQKAGEGSTTMSVVIDQVDIQDIVIRCGTAVRKNDFEIVIQHVSASGPENESMRIEADGTVGNVNLEWTLVGGDLNSLLNDPASFPLDMSLRSNLVSIDVNGAVLAPFQDPELQAEFDLQVDDVQTLAASIGFDLPALGAMQAGGVVRASAASIDVEKLFVELAESNLSANSSLDLSGERPSVEVTANLEVLDLKPFLNDTAVAQALGEGDEADDFDLPQLLAALDTVDADVQLTIERMLGSPIETGVIVASGRLLEGGLDLRALIIDVHGSEVEINGKFNGNSACPELTLIGRATDVDLAIVNRWQALDAAVGGKIAEIGLESNSCGDHFFAHRNSLRAKATLSDARIRIGNESTQLAIEESHVSIAYDKPVQIGLVGVIGNERVQATLEAGTLEEMFGPGSWPIEFDLRGSGGLLQLAGHAGPLTDQFVLDASVQLDAPKIGSLHNWTAGPTDATLPLRASLQLHYDASSVVADSIEIRFGGSDLGGRMVWMHAQYPDTMSITTRSGFLDIDEILGAVSTTMDEPGLVVQLDDGAGAPATSPGFEIPQIDLDLAFESVNFNQLDLQNIDLTGRLSRGHIADASISAVLEDDVELRGALDLDIRSTPATGALTAKAEQVNIGSVLAKIGLVDDLQLQAGAIELDLTSSGSTPRLFVLNTLLHADIRDFNWTLPGTENGTREMLEVNLAEVKLSTGPDLGTTLESRGNSAGIPVEALARLPSLQEVFGNVPELPLKLAAAVGNNVAIIDANIDRTAEQGLKARVVMSGAVIDSEGRALADLSSPLADYEISSNVDLTKNEWRLPDLKMRLGSSTVDADFSWVSVDERRRADIDLHATRLQTDDLLYWTTSFRDAMGVEDSQSIEVEQQAEETMGDVNDKSGFVPLLRDYIADFREHSDLDLNFVVDEFHAGQAQMGGAEMHLHVDDDEFVLKPLHITSAAGDVDAEYSWKIVEGNIDVGLKVHADAVSYGGLLRLIDHESKSRGLMYLDIDISAQTDKVPDVGPLEFMLKNAGGKFDLAAWPENAKAGLLDLWTGNLVLALLPSPTAEQSNTLNCLAVRLEMEEGVLQTGTALIDSTTTIIRGRGKIDLAEETLDLLAAPQAKLESFFSMSTPVKVTGPFDDFQIGVEPAGVFGTAVKWWMNLIYVPFKWLTGQRFPANGTATCFDAMDWELTPELEEYFLQLSTRGETD